MASQHSPELYERRVLPCAFCVEHDFANKPSVLGRLAGLLRIIQRCQGPIFLDDKRTELVDMVAVERTEQNATFLVERHHYDTCPETPVGLDNSGLSTIGDTPIVSSEYVTVRTKSIKPPGFDNQA